MDDRRLLSPTGTKLEPLEKQIYQRLKQFRPQFKERALITAVSGGIDSVSLLYVLKSLETRLGYKLYIAHINHTVRGKASDRDARFVMTLSRQMKIPISMKKLKGISKNVGENQLRQARYTMLFELKKKLRASFIVTAHHQDDLLETRLMRLLQGTGIHGLRAMTLLSDDGIFRPFLFNTRRDIEIYAKTKDLAWRNDATNEDTTKLRNWIRRNWLAVLRNEHPEYQKNLALSLERLVQSNPIPAPASDLTFDRSQLRTAHESEMDLRIHSYLRYHGQARVTSRHVSEFKKQILSKKKYFIFRLAGVNWRVEKNLVQPL